MKLKAFIVISLILIFSIKSSAQLGIGLKAGLNFANVTGASSINASNAVGFLVGAFFAPPTNGVLGSRTEFIFSREGYDYSTNSAAGSVRLNYIMLPQLLCINITKFVQIQAGAEIAYLLSATADTASGNSVAAALSYFNRFDYGLAGGLEIHPFKGIMINARYTYSLGNLYQDVSENPVGTQPSFIPKIDAKKNVIQLSAGYIF